MTLDDIKNIKIKDFDYPLPDDRIAKHPLADRDACKLLQFQDGRISHHIFRDLPDLLPDNSLLVMNNTRVINARMEFRRASGARIEIFLLEPLEPRDYAEAFQTTGRCRWQCMVGNLKKWKDEFLEKDLIIDGFSVTLRATRLEALPGNSHAIDFSWSPSLQSSENGQRTTENRKSGSAAFPTFASIVEAAGNIPIPPYLNRDSEESDSSDYQTVYSRVKGSVAAPTAGLHFTPELLDKLHARGIETREVTLHVGAGTFQPVKSKEIGEHPMHTEVFEFDLDLIHSLINALETGRPVFAVGTTTVRTLESLPLLAEHLTESDPHPKVSQWEAYSKDLHPSLNSLRRIERYMIDSGEKRMTASTAIMIAPGFPWRIVDGMVTNFHQPQSTLLLLVSSLLDGSNLSDPSWRRIYQEALDNDYRFLSYGDACLFFQRKTDNGKRTTDNGQRTTENIHLPGSKSIAARALICRLLGGHDTILSNLPDCGDTRAMLRLTETVRRALRNTENGKRKTENGQRKTEIIDIGEGGTTLRFGLAACASIPGLDITLTGSPRLMQRPHDILINALRNMGADITLIPEENAIHIIGKQLVGGEIELDGSVSSQYVSALMLAAPMWRNSTTIRLTGNLVSTPYINMTAGVMKAFGAHLTLHSSPFTLKIDSIPYPQCAAFDIEGDWSAASYFFETRLIRQALGLHPIEIEMPSLKAPSESLQGDSRVAEIFADASKILKNPQLNNLTTEQRKTLNLNDTPDLVPAVAVALCIARIPFRIEGIAHLRHKETDRMAAITTELAKLGFVVRPGADSMEWTGERCDADPAPLIRTYRDHRMAMAFAPAKLAFPGLHIEDPAVVDKSFPGFWKEIDKMKVKI